MKLPLLLKSAAQVEFEEAYERYEALQPGLGVDFLRFVQQAFDRITLHPKMHQIVFADVRQAVIRKFPYCVYYRIEVKRIVVIAIFHSKRDPQIWKARV